MLYVTKDAVDLFITSWNHHRVSGHNGCIPTENIKATKRTAVIADFLIPSTSEAVLMYEQNGGRLNREGEFGRDPLVAQPNLYESVTVLFSLNAPPPKVIFSELVHGNNRLLLTAREYPLIFQYNNASLRTLDRALA